MKFRFAIYTCIGLMVILSLGTVAHGQQGNRVNATIPFDFRLAGRTVPAGSYELEKLNNKATAGAIAVRRSGGSAVALISGLASGCESGRQRCSVAKLKFFRVGDGPWNLFEIRFPDANYAVGRRPAVPAVPAVPASELAIRSANTSTYATNGRPLPIQTTEVRVNK
jgi:hypothetical protein